MCTRLMYLQIVKAIYSNSLPIALARSDNKYIDCCKGNNSNKSGETNQECAQSVL